MDKPAWIALCDHLENVWGQGCQFWQLGGPDYRELEEWWLPAPAAELPKADRSQVEPLETVKVFRHAGSPDHFDYVGFGLSDLYARWLAQPEDENFMHAGYSGWGFELTMRLPVQGESTFPIWPVNVIAGYSRYVLTEKRPFVQGDYVDNGGPIFPEAETSIEGFAFTIDRELGTATSASGLIEMLQLVGLTTDELALCRKHRTSTVVVDALTLSNPLLITDWKRESVLSNSDARKFISERESELSIG